MLISESANSFQLFKNPIPVVDRILHIGHKFSGAYNKELLQRAAEVCIYKGPAALTAHLTEVEKLDAADAQKLTQNIVAELRSVNRSILWQYAVALLVLLTVVVFSLNARSYIFAAFFALPALLLLRSALKFLRRNRLQ